MPIFLNIVFTSAAPCNTFFFKVSLNTGKTDVYFMYIYCSKVFPVIYLLHSIYTALSMWGKQNWCEQVFGVFAWNPSLQHVHHICVPTLPCTASYLVKPSKKWTFSLSTSVYYTTRHRCYINSPTWFLPESCCCAKEDAFLFKIDLHKSLNLFWAIKCVLLMFCGEKRENTRKWDLWNGLNSIIDSHPTTEVVRRGMHK